MALLLFVLFLVFCGRVTLEICVVGAVVTAAILAFCHAFLSYSLRKEWLCYRLLPFAVGYLALLGWEICKAAFSVAGVILKGKSPEEGVFVSFSSGLHSSLAKTILANSITLTPGTVTVHTEGDRFLVHCLLPSFGEGLENSSFVRRLRVLDTILEKKRGRKTK